MAVQVDLSLKWHLLLLGASWITDAAQGSEKQRAGGRRMYFANPEMCLMQCSLVKKIPVWILVLKIKVVRSTGRVWRKTGGGIVCSAFFSIMIICLLFILPFFTHCLWSKHLSFYSVLQHSSFKLSYHIQVIMWNKNIRKFNQRD